MKAFKFGDIVSREYGVGISGTGTFDAPERDVDIIDIPGRNGSIVQDNGRFHNIQVTYPAFISRGFDELFPRFKAAMMQYTGYQKLTDEYDPEHYREAMFSGPMQPRTGVYNKSGKFDIVFNCKPQRFLTSGAEAVTYMPVTATSTGSRVAGIEVTPGTRFSVRGTYPSGRTGNVVVTYYTSAGASIRADTTAISAQAVSYTGTVPANAATATVDFPVGENGYITIINDGATTLYNDTGIVLLNPTPYAARPVMTFYGASDTTISLGTYSTDGTVYYSSYGIAIDTVTAPAVTIDSTISDCYYKDEQYSILVNLNPDIMLLSDQLTGALAYDFPVIQGNAQMVIPAVGFTKAVIAPGWWEV